MDDPDSADVDDNFKLLLDFVRKVTEGACRPQNQA
jgi:hypothetical protein